MHTLYKKDCLREIQNQFVDTNNYANVNEMKKRFQDDIIYRLKNISEQTEKGIKRKSDLFASLLGGYIAFGQNLQAKAYAFKNHHRVKAFYYSEFINNVNDISELPGVIKKGNEDIIKLLKIKKNNNKKLKIETQKINSGWGKFYNTDTDITIELTVIDDVRTTSVKKVEEIESRKWGKGSRDKYHYEVAKRHLNDTKKEHGVILVADKGFISYVGKKNIKLLRIMQMNQIDFASRTKVKNLLYTNYDLAINHTIYGDLIGSKERKMKEVCSNEGSTNKNNQQIKTENWYYPWKAVIEKEIVPVGWRIPSKKGFRSSLQAYK